MSNATFIMRWDDVSPYQEEKKYKTLIEFFVTHNIPVVLGVIPDNADQSLQRGNRGETEFVDELKQLQAVGWEIAQHGYRHLKHTSDGGILGINPASEFAGRNYDDQKADIEGGKKILAGYGFDPITFVPPWHSYDNATLQALGETGFKVLSDGIFLYPRMAGTLLQLPQILWSVPHRITSLKRLGSVYTLCLHPQSVTADDIKSLAGFFRRDDITFTTAAAYYRKNKRPARRGPFKRLNEFVFSRIYKKQT